MITIEVFMEIRNLDLLTPFGFESKSRWQVAIHQIENDPNKQVDDEHRLWGKEKMVSNNAAKILSYIPVLNVIIGVARIILFANNFEANSNHTQHIFRGIADILLGPLMFIIDIIQTLRDQSVVNEYVKAYPNALLIQHPEELPLNSPDRYRRYN
jgi:hypothetical protein